MHVAFIGTYGLWTPHLETELEIAEDHLGRGDRVTWMLCDGAYDSCDSNAEQDRVLCRACTWKTEMGLSLLSDLVEVERMAEWLTAEDQARVAGLPEGFESQEALKAFTFDGVDVGWATLSSAIWAVRDTNVDTNSALVTRLVRACVTGYLATRNLIATHPTLERIYVFNGRMAPLRGVLRAVDQAATAGRKIDCHIHERGQDIEHYAVFPNAMPHEIGPSVQRMNALWDGSDLPEEERRRIGAEWFEGRPKGKQGSWINFVQAQAADALPGGWDPAAHNVVLFPTSEFEYAAIGKEWESPLSPSPQATTMWLARELSSRGTARLTIRLHPNPHAAQSSSVKEALALDLPGVTVIAPDSEVSTYDLMRAADVVVTSGSTAGIEATFWGRPSILAGRSLYSGTGGAHEPATREELLTLVERRDLPVADRDAALRYGFYQATRGLPYRHFHPEGLQGGRFKEQQVAPTELQRRILRLRAVLAARS